MKLLVIFSALTLLAGPAAATSWEDVSPGGLAGGSGDDGPANPPRSTRSLTFIYDEDTFLMLYPGLTWEGFDSTNVPSGAFLQCSGPFNSATDNDCFSPGAIVDGITLDASDDGVTGGEDLAVLADGFLGNETVWVGPMWFNDHTFIWLDPGVSTFGCFIVFPNGDSEVEIEVFGELGSLGVDTITGTTGGGFWGVSSSLDVITRVVFTAPYSNGEVFDYVYFGGGPVPVESSSWGSVKSIYR